MGCAFFAAIFTTVTVKVDHARVRHSHEEFGLRWARQVASQAEALASYARRNGKRDPLVWAARTLQQGKEPRLIHVYKAKTRSSTDPLESWVFDGDSGGFDYIKVIQARKQEAIRVLVFTEYVGFLGTREKGENDIAIGVFWLVSFLISFFFMLRTPLAHTSEKQIRKKVGEWVQSSKVILIELGGQIRDIIREATGLVVAAKKSREELDPLREKIDSGLSEVIRFRKHMNECTDEANRLVNEIELMNSESDPDQKQALLPQLSSRMGELSKKTHEIIDETETLAQKVQGELEDCIQQVDRAYTVYDDVFRSSSGMEGTIQEMTRTLMGHVKQVNKLSSRVAEEKQLLKPSEIALANIEEDPSARTVFKNDDLLIDAKSQAGKLILRLTGDVDESVHFAPVIELVKRRTESEAVSTVQFDLGNVTRLNSSGVRQWLRFLDTIQSMAAVEFIKVNQAVIEQTIVAPNFLGKEGNRIHNFEAPYKCPECSHKILETLEPSEVIVEDGEIIPPSFDCERCGALMDFDGEEKDYFGFLEQLIQSEGESHQAS